MNFVHTGGKFNQRILQVAVIILVGAVALMELFFIHEMRENFLDSIGKRAVSIAVMEASDTKISNADVEHLLSLEFTDLLNDPVNVAFEDHAREIMGYAHVKYIYVMRKLSSVQVKYTINADEVDYYELPAGERLDTIYLLDAVIDRETRLEDTDGQWYTDKDRYTVLRKPEAEAYFSRETSYALSDDEWGSYVTGYAPLYSIEGDYIGILGVDVFFDEYTRVINRQIFIISVIAVLCTLLSIIFLLNLARAIKAEEAANQFKQKSYYDDMTQMLNRRMLSEYSETYWNEALLQKVPLSAMMTDIDNFKRYNDVYGHATGDHIIMGVANTIKNCVREGKDLSFRYGGDEFLVLFFNTDIKVVSTLAERIQNQLQSLKIGGVKENITLSFGISSTIPYKNSNLFELIERADQSLYQSKRNGGDQMSIYSERERMDGSSEWKSLK